MAVTIKTGKLCHTLTICSFVSASDNSVVAVVTSLYRVSRCDFNDDVYSQTGKQHMLVGPQQTADGRQPTSLLSTWAPSPWGRCHGGNYCLAEATLHVLLITDDIQHGRINQFMYLDRRLAYFENGKLELECIRMYFAVKLINKYKFYVIRFIVAGAISMRLTTDRDKLAFFLTSSNCY